MKKLSTRRKATMAVFILLAAAAGGFIFWLQSGNSGEIKQPKQVQKEVNPTGSKQLDGQYMRFEYPAAYFARQLENRGGDLELHQLDAGTAYTKKIAISVSNLPDGTLASNSAYLLRKNRPDMYQKRDAKPGQLNAEVWVSSDNSEQTVFITQNGRAAILAFTQAGGDKNLLTVEVDRIIQSFEWK